MRNPRTASKARQALFIAFDQMLQELEPRLIKIPKRRHELVEGLIRLGELWTKAKRKEATPKDLAELQRWKEELSSQSADLARIVRQQVG